MISCLDLDVSLLEYLLMYTIVVCLYHVVVVYMFT